ncbi:MAG: hypothetical protein LBF60_09340 [Treponema sp.]|nr:hypothetical protein [Treponema sp.]
MRVYPHFLIMPSHRAIASALLIKAISCRQTRSVQAAGFYGNMFSVSWGDSLPGVKELGIVAEDHV